jgi:hypothetical protein
MAAKVEKSRSIVAPGSESLLILLANSLDVLEQNKKPDSTDLWIPKKSIPKAPGRIRQQYHF